MITLAISHNIGLTREQRYALDSGETIETIGVSVPVWFLKGNTSEPAREVFCKYKITNKPKDYQIKILMDGYQINLPQVEEQQRELEKLPPILASLLGVNIQKFSKKALLDVTDGGSEWMQFRQTNKAKHNGLAFNVVHFVEIRPIEEVVKSLT